MSADLFTAILTLWRPTEALPCAIGGLFGGRPKPPPPPPPQPMPDLLDPAILAAKRRPLEDVRGRGGRASTLLTGDDYQREKLGSR